MKKIVVLSLLGFLVFGCGTIDQTALIGHWKNKSWEFIFREDGKCSIGNNGNLKSDLKYSLLGNSMEISQNGKVIISGLTISDIKGDSLFIQFRNLVGSGDQMDNNQILLRQ